MKGGREGGRETDGGEGGKQREERKKMRKKMGRGGREKAQETETHFIRQVWQLQFQDRSDDLVSPIHRKVSSRNWRTSTYHQQIKTFNTHFLA